MSGKTIKTIAGHFTENRYKKLKARYDEALQNGENKFEFEGHPFLASFVKYLLQYLEGEFACKKK